jgi:signal transduction histidine kinase
MRARPTVSVKAGRAALPRRRGLARARGRAGARRVQPRAWISIHPADLLEVVAHELRTPVTSLYGSTHLLEHHTLSSWTRTDLLSEMSLDVARLVRFLGDLLALAEATSGEVRMEPVMVQRVTEDVIRSVMRAYPLVPIELEAVPAAPPAMADAPALEHALDNLLRHAVRSAPAGGSVRVSIGSKPGHVTVAVRERLDREAEGTQALLDRADPMVEPGGRLWLATAQALVHAMRGELSVKVRGNVRIVRVALRTLDDEA